MLITHFKPQVEEIICDLYFQGYIPSELTSPFSNQMYWWQSAAYEKVSLHFDSAEMDVKGWLCAVEAITGNEGAFNLALIQCFEEAIEQQWEIRMSEGQAVLEFEQERELVSV
jgi:hypothetical protein